MNRVYVSSQQRAGNKSTTIIEGLEDDLDIGKIVKHLRRQLKCNGSVKKNHQGEGVIILQGDHKTEVKEFLVKQELCEEVIIRGV